tara:strand:+ start:268 stop:708 length:441 start_codon:yes stop_codon:yes gene_type:complete
MVAMRKQETLEYIQGNAGVHLRGIKNHFDAPIRSVVNRLKKLENEGKVFSVKDGKYRYYYPISMKGKEPKLKLTPKQKEIVFLLDYFDDEIPISEFVYELDIKRTTIVYHLKFLLKNGFVGREKKKGTYYYFKKGEKDERKTRRND